MTATLLKSLTDILQPVTGDSSTPRVGLQRLLALRALLTVAGVSGTLIFELVSPLPLSPVLLWGLLTAVLLSLALGYWRMQTSAVINEAELFIQLLVDVLILIVILLYTGGASNPLISYLLVLLAVAATLIRQTLVNLFALLSVAIYTLFLVSDLQSGAQHDMNAPDMEDFQRHLVGMWVTFVLSAILITVFITHMAAAIRRRELSLAKVRENEMRNEQLVAIGTLAAGTAHALGTPLSTMSVILSDLLPEHAGNDDQNNQDNDQHLDLASIRSDIHLLQQQVERCKDSLQQLTRFYNKTDNQDEEQTLVAIVAEIRDYLVNIHPQASISIDIDETVRHARLFFDLSLRHALINIIENSIKAASTHTKVTFRKPDPHALLEIAIQDDGPGIPLQVMENLGEPFISTRKDSMGLGIFLANAAIQRSQGSIEMFNLNSGGSLTVIRLPIRTKTEPDSGRESPEND
ncbi:MAG: ATP-binding protein [Pseudomonadales bacterium]|nr:ATP-binding protein [Pseudomonadales bacterium]